MPIKQAELQEGFYSYREDRDVNTRPKLVYAIPDGYGVIITPVIDDRFEFAQHLMARDRALETLSLASKEEVSRVFWEIEKGLKKFKGLARAQYVVQARSPHPRKDSLSLARHLKSAAFQNGTNAQLDAACS